MQPGKNKDGYIDNDMILRQFERFFQMAEFKESYTNRKIIMMVDNATTHTAKAYSIEDFSKKIGTLCSTEFIEREDNGLQKKVSCFFKSGPNKGKSLLN